jgi:dTMP kinase
VLRNVNFRRLWISFALSSVGDWLGILATALVAQDQVTGELAKGAAFGGTIVVRLLPSLLLGPVAGFFADRFDRRLTMIVCDILRFALFASIPLAGTIGWTLGAVFLIEMVGMFWIPAKEAAVPNLVRKDQLEAANQLSLMTTYGVTPVAAAGLLSLFAWISGQLDQQFPRFSTSQVNLALYFNALTFLVSAGTVFFVRQMGGRVTDGSGQPPGFLSAVSDGWRFIRRTPLVRGLVVGIFGAFFSGGFVVGTGTFYARSLSGGEAAFGLLFGALFVGLALGIGLGPRLARDLSRRRWFGESIVLAGFAVALLSVMPHLFLAILVTMVVGLGAGMAYLAGMTLLGSEVDDELRGRTFGFIQAMVKVVLMLAVALASLLVGVFGTRRYHLAGMHFTISSSRLLLVLGGLIGIAVGVVAFHQMDDKPGVPVIADLVGSLRDRPLRVPGRSEGLLVAFEGGEGAGKSTQVQLLAGWLAEQHRRVVVTREPGATPIGARIRNVVLDRRSNISARAEALLYAADRAHHVDTVIKPAMAGGAVVLTDRYVDSSLAYQGAGRNLPMDEVAKLSRWATGDLRPDLVVLLDIDPRAGLLRVGQRSEVDRLEAESLEFHDRVRAAFLALAEKDHGRYLVVDATDEPIAIAERVRARLTGLLGPVPRRERPQVPVVVEEVS